MSRTYAEELRDMAARSKPYNMFFHRVAEALDKLARVEQAAFEAHDCLGGEDELRAILARVCDPAEKTHDTEE